MNIPRSSFLIYRYFNRPLLFITLAFIAGIAVGDLLAIPFIPALILMFIGIIVYVAAGRKSVLIFFQFFFLGICLISHYLTFIPGNDIRHIKNVSDVKSYSLLVNEMPKENEDRIYLTGKVVSLFTGNDEIKSVSGKIRVVIDKKINLKISYGDIIHIKAGIKRPPEPTMPGEFDYKKYLRYRKVFFTSFVKDYNIVIKGRKIENYFKYYSYKFKEKLLKVIYGALPHEEARILDGIMLGNQRVIPVEIYDKFKISGTVHILAVSGMNVGLIALFVFLVLKVFGIKRKTGSVITLLFVTVFAIITGADASIIRATIMAYVVLISMLIEKDVDIYNSLAVAAFLILILNPSDLFNVGFQLSFLATFGIIYFAEKGMELLPALPQWLALTLVSTITAQIFLMPVLANTFHQVSLISVAANIVVVPLSSTITILGFVMWGVGLISISVAKIFGASIWILIKVMNSFIDVITKIPYAGISVKSIPAFWMGVYYTAFLILPFSDINLKVKRVNFKYALFVLLGVSMIYHVAISPRTFEMTNFETVGIDSGFVRTHANTKILILGNDTRSDFVVKSKIIPYLRSRGINTIDILVLVNIKNQKNIEHVKRNFRVGREIETDKGNFMEMSDKYAKIEIQGRNVKVLSKEKVFVLNRKSTARNTR